MQFRDTTDLRVPAARTIDLVTTGSNDEVLVYDQTVHHIHHLNASAAQVWRLCDGKRTVGDVAVEAGLTEDAVTLALRTLEDAQLLDGPLATTMRGTQSRRAFMKKAALAGAVAVPTIASISAPAAANHTSTCSKKHGGAPCHNKGECCSDVCEKPAGQRGGAKFCVGG